MKEDVENRSLPCIVLATGSSYKIALFERLGLPFTSCSPDYEEIVPPGRAPEHVARELAEGKARSLVEVFPDHLIIGADQVLALGSEIFQKPQTTERAVAQLMRLRGKTHFLHTAVYLLNTRAGENDRARHLLVSSAITFYDDLDEGRLHRLVEADASQDCVGGYKFESRGVQLMKRVETSDTNAIVGLPLLELVGELRDLGYFDESL